MKAVLAGGEHALMEIIAASHAGNTTAEFEQIVTDWVATAKHPKTGRLYTEMVYEPMLEVLAYLRANGFKTYIVSSGGVEFMRPWAERVYGIPPEQVVGSRGRMKYEVRGGVPVLARLPEIDLVDDKAGNRWGSSRRLAGVRSIAFGNSDGDFEMLEWTTTALGPRLWRDRPPHGCRPRVGLRPRLAHRTPRPRSGRGCCSRLGRRGHETGVGADLLAFER